MADARLTQEYVEIINTGDQSAQQARVTQLYIQVISTGAPAPLRFTQTYVEVVSTGPIYQAAGHADGISSAVAYPSFEWTRGNADGFADVLAHSTGAAAAIGHADGFANAAGTGHNVIKTIGNADGSASVAGLSGQPATGHADGFASVFSSPGGLKSRTGSAWLFGI
jgi:hypothetical protein